MEQVADAEVIELGRSLQDGTGTDAIGRRACIIALGLTLEQDPEQFSWAKRLVESLVLGRRARKVMP